jgi:uroporphyrinogen decarboxylase-like protein
MHPQERILRTLEGKSVDRVPNFCAMMEDRTFNEILGKPLIPQQFVFQNPITRGIMNKWGPQITQPIFQPVLNAALEKRIKGAAKLGFDSTWAIYEESFILKDANTMVRVTGSIFDILEDGYGNMTYMYREPGITSREDFEAWPYWPNADDVAHRSYKFFKKMVKKYSSDMCLMGQGSAYGIQESLLWTVGFERMSIWLMREKDLVQRFIDITEELCMKTIMAVMDAGIDIIIQTDDFAYKSGPMMNPKLIDTVFGPSYKRLIKAVHDRGGKFILHSCGDNTLLMDMFIEWGVDGLHAYENTSNVDIFKEKEMHGDQVTIIGGVGVDYLLTDRSTDEEIVEEVKKLIKALGPGGRFIIGPVHSLSSIPADKMEVMLDAVETYGKYSMEIN